MRLVEKIEVRPNSLEVLGDASVAWRYVAPAGDTLEMCQRPDYWKHHIRELGQQRVLGRLGSNSTVANAMPIISQLIRSTKAPAIVPAAIAPSHRGSMRRVDLDSGATS